MCIIFYLDLQNHFGFHYRIHGESFDVITRTDSQLELSFIRNWNVSINETTWVPINIDKRSVGRCAQHK